MLHPSPTEVQADAVPIGREHAALVAEYGRAQARCTSLLARQSKEIERLQATVVRLRAAVMLRDTQVAVLREQHAALERAVPGLPRRAALARRVEGLVGRVQQLLRERRVVVPSGLASSADGADDAARLVPADLHQKAVLCVGEDTHGLTQAQHAVERAGGQFLHHDGQDAAALEASLVAADLVICQTGCVSHGAYWRVQDHCRRTGKQCVLVDEPQAIRLVRGAAVVVQKSSEDAAGR